MAGYKPSADFRISLRMKLRIGGAASGPEDEPVLRGTAADITGRVQKYAEAGLDELVIEPESAEAGDFIEQLSRFMTDVAAPGTD
jgi:hypothetical protein